MATSKEVSTIGDASEYVALTGDTESLKLALAENIGEDGLNEFDIDRIKVPSGGGLAWEVPTLEGTDTVRELSGIIVAWFPRRAYWPGKFAGAGEPPQCSSVDGKIGVGDPGGQCQVCPLAQFGSEEESNAQACKAMRQLFFLQPGDMLPTVVTLPPTSLKGCRQYFFRLSKRAIPHTAVVTRLTLEKEKSGGGFDYSRVSLSMVQQLTPEAQKTVRDYATALMPQFERVTVTSADVDESPDF